MGNTTDIKIKICGITNLEDALVAANSGADALGFIFVKDSKRYIEPETARDIISKLPPFITKVGVFVNSNLNEIVEIKEKTHIDIAQLHGDETIEFCRSIPFRTIKVIRVKDRSNIELVAQYPDQDILFDTYSDKEYGGTGTTFDWTVLKDLSLSKKVILSGGLNSDNVAEAVKVVVPYAVDVSSGVEARPGKKDHNKIKRFIEAIKNGN